MVDIGRDERRYGMLLELQDYLTWERGEIGKLKGGV